MSAKDVGIPRLGLRSSGDGFVEGNPMSTSKRTRQAIWITTTVLGLIGRPAVGQAADVHYRCADGTMLVARFRPGRVGLTIGQGVVNLPQARSADGGRYIAGDLTFWIKGRGATLTRGATQTYCSALP